MKKILFSLTALTACVISFAQAPEDVLRYSYFPQRGSARNMAIGGAMGSLGGDINALYVNPAGLGFYKTDEVIISPGWQLNKNKFSFRGSDSTTNRSFIDFGTTGIVGSLHSGRGKWANSAIALAITQTANFDNKFTYSGYNNISSFAEQYVEQFSNSGLTIDQALNEPSLAFGTAPALYTYLVDTFRNANGNLEVKSLPQFLQEQGIKLRQENTVKTSGGIYELALGYGANMSDKLFLGGSVGLPFVSYNRYTTYKEIDPTGNDSNYFGSFQYTDSLHTRGWGLNLKLGLIYKPSEFIRLGFAFHTPTFYSLTDKESSGITTNSENYAGTLSAASRLFSGTAEGKTKYLATTPWKVIVSGSYVFREINDTRKQRGFITADIEYVRYRGSRFHSDEEGIFANDDTYYKDLKNVIQDYYKGAFNFRVGGELKFNTIMFRLGGAYYGNPYKQSDVLKSNIVQASGGLGYRNHGFFIDLTYVHNIIKDVNFPYRLNDKANTFAEQKTQRGNIMVTVGFKL